MASEQSLKRLHDDGDNDHDDLQVNNSKVPKKEFYDFINLAYLCDCTQSETDCLQFCQHFGLLPRHSQCVKCQCPIKKITKRAKRAGALSTNQLYFACTKKACNSFVSVKRNTWFEKSRISMRKTLLLTYMFVMQADMKLAVKETSGPSFGFQTTSTETVGDLYMRCRDVCIKTLSDGSQPTQIGGTNHTVELDITSFGNREVASGKQIKTHYVVAGICRESDECFFASIEDCTEDAVLAAIVERVEQGTVIITAASPVFSKLSDIGYRHLVSDTTHRVQSQATDTTTDDIKTTLQYLKKSMPMCVRKENINGYLAEYQWQRRNRDKKCLFVAFLKDIAKVHPGL